MDSEMMQERSEMIQMLEKKEEQILHLEIELDGMEDKCNAEITEAVKLLDKLYDKLGDISPVSASEFLGMNIDRRIIRFMIQHGPTKWIDWTDGIPTDVLKTWPQEVQELILIHYGYADWEEFDND